MKSSKYYSHGRIFLLLYLEEADLSKNDIRSEVIENLFNTFHYIGAPGWLSVGPVTLDFQVMSLSPKLGVEIT